MVGIKLDQIKVFVSVDRGRQWFDVVHLEQVDFDGRADGVECQVIGCLTERIFNFFSDGLHRQKGIRDKDGDEWCEVVQIVDQGEGQHGAEQVHSPFKNQDIGERYGCAGDSFAAALDIGHFVESLVDQRKNDVAHFSILILPGEPFAELHDNTVATQRTLDHAGIG